MTDSHICCGASLTLNPLHILRKSQLTSVYDRYEKAVKPPLRKLNDIRLNFIGDDNLKPTHEQWIPKPIITYVHTEDINPLDRMNFKRNPKTPSKRNTFNTTYYSTNDAQTYYLKSKPISFFICGKPNLEEMTDLGKSLAKYWNCQYLDPLQILNDEITSKTRAGQLLDCNLRLGCAIGFDILMDLCAKRIQGPTCQHCGFILTGMPIIPNEMFDECEPLVMELCGQEFAKSFMDEDNEQISEEQLFEVFDMSKKNQYFNIFTSLQEQFSYLKSFLNVPFVIIYLKCPAQEVIVKRSRLRFNLTTKQYISINSPFHKETYEANNFKYLIREPRDFHPNHVRDEVDHYDEYIKPLVEELILDHDQQYVITVDARTPLPNILKTIRQRLEQLPLQKVILPQPFVNILQTKRNQIKLSPIENEQDAHDEEGGEDEIEENIFPNEQQTPTQIFRHLQNVGVINKRFRWQLSDWGTKCPVALREGRSVDGIAPYAVQFMNKCFFLENELAMKQFCENPRVFLLPPNPQIPTKIIIFGMKYSGIIDVAKCLGYIFDAEVVDLDTCLREYQEIDRKTKFEQLKNQLIDEATEIVYEQLLNEWKLDVEATEKGREKWRQRILVKYYEYLSIKEGLEDVIDDQMNLDVIMVENVPVDEDFMRCAIENPNMLDRYIPSLYMVPKAPSRPSRYHPLVEKYVDEALHTHKITALDANELTPQLITSLLINSLNEIEYLKKVSSKNTIKTGGWIITNVDSESIVQELYDVGFVPNFVLFLEEDNEDSSSPYLFDIYKRKQFHNYPHMKQFLEMNGYIAAANRCPEFPPYSTELTCEFVQNLLLNIIHSDYRFKLIDDRIAEERLELINSDEEQTISTATVTETYESAEEESDKILFLNDLEKYKKLSKELHKFFEGNTTLNTITCNIDCARDIEDIMHDAANLIIQNYRVQVQEYDLSSSDLVPDEENEQTMEEEDAEHETTVKNKHKKYGDTHMYCPIALLKYGVLWKGKDNFAAIYNDKIYLTSNTEAFDELKSKPWNYIPFDTNPKFFPSRRLCVIGPIGCGKTVISKMLQNQFGIIYVDYIDFLNNQCVPDNYIIGRKFENIILVPKPEDSTIVDGNIYTNKSVVEQINNYYMNGEPLPEQCLGNILEHIWRIEPYHSNGIVVDGFPYCRADVDFMVKNYFIPNIVIFLKIDIETAQKRMLPVFLSKWNVSIKRMIEQQLVERQRIAEDWAKIRGERYKQILDDFYYKEAINLIADGTISLSDFQINYSEIFMEDGTKDLSKISVELLEKALEEAKTIDISEAKKHEINVILDKELPEPKFDDVWETEEEATVRFTDFINKYFEMESTFLEDLPSLLHEHLIPFLEIDGMGPIQEVIGTILLKLDYLKFQNESFYESTCDITMNEAQQLLRTGYYFLSRFGYTCPIQIFENHNPIQMFRIRTQLLKPVIHRQYIYFINGDENLRKFKENPLKYTTQERNSFPIYPLRVGIIGAPKCGKTTLANRFSNEFGLKIVTRGRAIRYVLNELPHTNLACVIDRQLRKGITLSHDIVMQAVELFCSDGNAITQGVIYDGFPTCVAEIEEFFDIGLLPHVIIHLDSSLKFTRSCLLTVEPSANYHMLLKHSEPFVKHKFWKWNIIECQLIEWLRKYCQNISTIVTKYTKWSNWTVAQNVTLNRFKTIMNYIENFHHGTRAWHLVNFCIMEQEFLERQNTDFLNYCPCCLYLSDTLNQPASMPPKHQNLIQFKQYFYYVCNKHVPLFLNGPTLYIDPNNSKRLPEILPERRRITKKSTINFYENGFCIVCYWDSKDMCSFRLIKGSKQFLCHYATNDYAFCSGKCRQKFMIQPTEYAFRKIHFKQQIVCPKITCTSLPIKGYLQQSQSRYLIEACTYLGKLRPKYPKLSAHISAAICLGLYLKLKNPQTQSSELRVYEKYNENLQNAFDDLKNLITKSKMFINPLIRINCQLWTSIDGHSDNTIILSAIDQNIDQNSDQNVNHDNVDELMLLEKYAPNEEYDYDEKYDYINNLSTTHYLQITSKTNQFQSDQFLIRRVPVPDERFEFLCNFYKPVSKVPAFLTVVDIAGLVKGASEGQGLGNAFLSEISACDAIFHLCRAFENEDVIHVEGDVNPIRDLEIIADELRYKDIEKLNKELEKLEKTYIRGNDKKLKPEYDTLQKVKTILIDDKAQIRFYDWNAVEIEVLNKHLFLTSKPGIYLVNLSEKDYIKKKNKWLIKIKEWVDKHDPGAIIIPFSGALELKLVEMPEDERKRYLDENKTTSALDKIIVQGYRALQLEYFFTCGPDEVKAWTIQKGAKAPQAAGKIHTDFEKGFIMAEVMKFADFKELGTEAAVKAAGKYRQQGRNYVVEDGDIIYFKANTGAGLGKKK